MMLQRQVVHIACAHGVLYELVQIRTSYLGFGSVPRYQVWTYDVTGDRTAPDGRAPVRREDLCRVWRESTGGEELPAWVREGVR